MARSVAVYRFPDILQQVLTQMYRWASENSLEFSYAKCNYTVIPPTTKKPASAPQRPLMMEGHRLSFKGRIVYLGVVIDSQLSWMPHLDVIREKALVVMQKLNRVARANWGLIPALRKQIYSAVAEKIVLYAATAWYDGKAAVNQRLVSIQRNLLLCVTKCYKTAPSDALCVLAGVLPLPLRAALDCEYSGLVRWNKNVDDLGLTSQTVELWKQSQCREDFWRIPWSLDLVPRSTYMYYTDGSKQENGHVGCAFLVVAEGRISRESQFRLTNGADVFAAEVHAIKAAITDARDEGLGEIDIYSDSRSALQALNGLVVKHKAIAEIKELVKQSGIKTHMHWIRAHVGHVYNERADELAKAATTRPTVDVEIGKTRRQAKKILLARAVRIWQVHWEHSDTGRITHAVFPRVGLNRLQGDFFVNQVLTGHGSFGDHQARMFRNNPSCFCGEGVSSRRHCLYRCPLWIPIREKFFPRDFHSRTPRDLCLDGYARKGVRIIVNDLLLRTLDRNMGRQRQVRYTRAPAPENRPRRRRR